MKKPFLYTFFCILLLSLYPATTKANYAAGGELIYEWVSGATYRFYFKLYRDCAGSTEPSTLPLCFSNSCNTSTYTATMTKFPATVPPFQFQCPQYQTKCQNPSSSLPGYQEIWYYADFTLPSQCNSWRIFTYLSTRSMANNIANATSSNMYIEAYFNNTGTFEGNTTPYYSVRPFLNACVNTPYSFNNGAVDPNSDSIVTEVVQPLTGTSSCSGTSSGAAFSSATPPYAVPGNPLQTNNSFTLNQQSGAITFTPTQAGTSTIAVRTKEYRNGVLIGSIMREMPVNVYACNSAPVPTISIVGGNGAIEGCTGQPLNVCWDVKSTAPNAILYVNDNHASVIPLATVSYQNQGTDSVRGCLSWTPGANISGLFNLVVGVTDSTCGMPGIIYAYTYAIPVLIWDKVTASPDTAVCAGTAVPLKLSGNNKTWAVISGDMNSLSCTNCQSPVATPSVSSQYEVTINNLPLACPVKKDTVYIDVIPYNKPSVNIAVNPGTNVWPGLNVSFMATATACDSPAYQWQVNGNNIPGATSAAYSSTQLADNDIVSCIMTCSDTCIIDTPSNTITMQVATGITHTSAAGYKLYPNPNQGSFTINAYNNSLTADISILNIFGQIVYSQENMRPDARGQFIMNTLHLPDGQYVLKMQTTSGTETLRFVVDRQ